jgi:GNAT superfamily N-acetyltransferase
MSHEDTASCDGWDGSECEGTVHCPARCPRFVDKRGARWTIRPAVRADVAPLAEMYERFGAENRAQGLPPVTRSRRFGWLDTLFSDGSNVVAERNGELYGHAVYTPTDTARPELAVFVSPDMQGRGVGTELCRHVIADAAAGGREGLELHVKNGNRVAQSVYRTVGFELAERNSDLRMTLDFDQPIATQVRWPPLVRKGSAETVSRNATPTAFDGAGAAGDDD